MFDMELTVKVKSKVEAARGVSTNEELKIEILENNEIYKEKIQLGERIYKVLMETNAKEESLSRQHKEALDLYQKKRLFFSSDAKVTLFNWQKGALSEFVNQPTNREVVWVKGARGNEGKTWFQNYVQSLLGAERVVLLNLKNSVGNIMQIL